MARRLPARTPHTSEELLEDASISDEGARKFVERARGLKAAAALIESAAKGLSSEAIQQAAMTAIEEAGLRRHDDTPASLRELALETVNELGNDAQDRAELLEGQALRFVDQAERKVFGDDQGRDVDP